MTLTPDRRTSRIARGRPRRARKTRCFWSNAGTPPLPALEPAGGKTEGSETPRAMPCRELKEETGIEAHVEGILDRVKVASYRLTVFYGRPAGGHLKAADDAESSRLG